MEEIDGIIIDSLKNLHCEIDEEITALKQFDASLVVSAIGACLETIIPGSSFHKKLPPSMSVKLKVASNLAQQIKDLGFREDIGYQTILYCNEAEIRRVLMFLIERLPRESNKISLVEQTGYVPLLVKDIVKEVKHYLEQFWLPPCVLNKGCRSLEDGSFLVHSFGDSSPLRVKKLQIPNSRNYHSDAMRQYWVRNVPEVTKQCTQKELIPSLIFKDSFFKDKSLRSVFKLGAEEKHGIDLVLDVPIESKQLGAKSEISEVKVTEDSENRIEVMVEELKEKQKRCVELQDEIKNSEVQLSQTNAMKCDEGDVLKNTLSKITLKSKTLTVLSKEENVAKLKNLIENSNNKLISLANQWNKVQTPLLEEYKTLQKSLSSEDLKLKEEQSKVNKLKDLSKGLSSDLKDKTALEQQLKVKMEQINKNHNRSGYTRRILEIIGNIKKQDEEIQKILRDTREVQKEINTLSGQVDRSFTLSDELIFRDCKQDETARKAYKLLAALRDECSGIIKGVTDLGLAERESRNLQEQIDSETSKEIGVKLERVRKDIDEIKRETESLLSQQKR